MKKILERNHKNNYKIKDLPLVERPREKLAKLGAQALTNTELLAIMLGSGTRGKNALKLAEKLLKRYGAKDLIQTKLEELKEIPGIGPVKAGQLIACFELSKRFLLEEDNEAPLIQSPQDVYEIVREIRSYKKEHFLAIYLNTRNLLIKKETISVGSLNANIVHPREVFHPGVETLAAALILVHNHPSGDSTPSEEDIKLTRRLVEAGKIMGIEVLDHIIVSGKGYVSLKEKNLI